MDVSWSGNGSLSFVVLMDHDGLAGQRAKGKGKGGASPTRNLQLATFSLARSE
jgi:hypothetical protein